MPAFTLEPNQLPTLQIKQSTPMTQEPEKPETATQAKAREPSTCQAKLNKITSKDCTPLDMVAQSIHRPNTTLIVNSSYKNNNNNNSKKT